MPEPRGPIFIVGPMGSGTTLMRLILDSHQDIAIAQETGFARALLANEWIPFYQFGGEWYGRLGMTQDELEKELGDFYGGLFARFAKDQGASRWGDKTPFHTWHIPLLARVFPDAVFVATARHPAAVAASIHRRMRYPWERAIRHWVKASAEMVYQGSQLGDRFILCRYEDLVTDPEPLLRQLLDRLGETWSDRLLDFHEVHASRGTAAEVEGHTRSDEPLDAGRVAAWTTTLIPERRARLQRRAAATLTALLGYQLDQPLPRRPLGDGADGGLLLNGDDLARLVSTHPGIRWNKLPKPALENRPLLRADLQRLRSNAAHGGPRRSLLAERVGRQTGHLARRAFRRLPPNGRRRIRYLLELGRR